MPEAGCFPPVNIGCACNCELVLSDPHCLIRDALDSICCPVRDHSDNVPADDLSVPNVGDRKVVLRTVASGIAAATRCSTEELLP